MPFYLHRQNTLAGRIVNWWEARKTRKRADAFNRKHTLTTEWRQDEGQWMCPSCGTTHKAVGWSFWTGSQYPSCCRYQDGHRVGTFSGGFD